PRDERSAKRFKGRTRRCSRPRGHVGILEFIAHSAPAAAERVVRRQEFESRATSMQGTERPFVWSRCGAEAGQELDSLILRKEAERITGQNVFWWGIGNSLGTNVRQAASECGGELDVQFSAMLMDA